MLTDEGKIIERLSQGDEESFRKLFEYYYPKAVSFLLALIQDENEAKDLAQNLFVKIWLIRSSLGKIRSLGAYLYRMCRNAAIDYGRTHKVKIPLEEHTDDSQSYDLDEEYFARERQYQVDRMVERMPQKRKQVFLMSRKQGKSNEEISAELGISKKTVENHINAALKELRKITSCIAFFL